MTQQTLTPSELFKDFARDGFGVAIPAEGTAGLFRAVATGSCLEPIVVAGDELYIDLGAKPVHGDLVYFEWPPEIVDQWRATERSAEWIERWGTHEMLRGLKLYWEFPRECPAAMQDKYLLTNEDATRVKAHKLLGVVRAVARNGVLRATLGLAACASLDPNAATVVFIASSATTGGTVGLPAGNHPDSVLSGSAGASPAYNCTAIVTTTIVGGQSGGTAGLTIAAAYTDDGTTWSYGPAQQLTLSPLPYTLQWQFSHSASNAGSAWVAGVNIANPTAGTLTFQYGTGTFTTQVEYIKK